MMLHVSKLTMLLLTKQRLPWQHACVGRKALLYTYYLYYHKESIHYSNIWTTLCCYKSCVFYIFELHLTMCFHGNQHFSQPKIRYQFIFLLKKIINYYFSKGNKICYLKIVYYIYMKSIVGVFFFTVCYELH